MPIDLQPDHLQLVHNILKQHLIDEQVWVFGSRAIGRATRTSDLDLCIKGKAVLPFGLLGELLDDFSESNLPYKVDVVDWHSISDSFKKIVERDKEPLSLN